MLKADYFRGDECCPEGQKMVSEQFAQMIF